MASEPPKVEFPPPPTDLDSATSYLSWLTDAAARNLIDFRSAQAAAKAVEMMIRVQGFAQRIRDLTRQVKDLTRAQKAANA